MQNKGSAIFKARQSPITGVVQICDAEIDTISCAVTLWPGPWQDWELIGSWKLGAFDDKDREKESIWKIPSENGNHFSMISINALKDTTVEISAPRDQICGNNGSINVKETDILFKVAGRKRGVEQMISDEARIHIENQKPFFSEKIKIACKYKNM